MKSTKLSQIVLLVGLVVGLTALWVGATPVVGVGPTGVGGWEQMFIDGVWVAVYPDNGSWETGRCQVRFPDRPKCVPTLPISAPRFLLRFKGPLRSDFTASL